MAGLECLAYVDYSLAIKAGVHFTLCGGTLCKLGTRVRACLAYACWAAQAHGIPSFGPQPAQESKLKLLRYCRCIMKSIYTNWTT
jgi:hypothetical protein